MITHTQTLPTAQVRALRDCIKRSWRRLTRSNTTLLASLNDPKAKAAKRLTLYVPRDEDPAQIAARLNEQLTPADPSTTLRAGFARVQDCYSMQTA